MAPNRTLYIFAGLLAALVLSACGSERSINPYDMDATTDSLPSDSQWIGDRVITNAALDGDLAEVQSFAGPARVRVDDYGRGFTMVELAMNTGDRAVMHRLEIDGGLDHEDFTAGTAHTFNPSEAPDREGAAWVYPVACSGPDVDLWEVDVPVQQVDLSIEEGPTEGSLLYDWTLTKNISLGGEPTTQVSHGSVLLSEPGPVAQ
jgi:hypothetical protein